jgi:hypothetical protein
MMWMGAVAVYCAEALVHGSPTAVSTTEFDFRSDEREATKAGSQQQNPNTYLKLFRE